MSAKRKWTVDELTQLAFIHAESDRRNMADCDPSEYGREQLELAEAMRAYRVKRWGKTGHEIALENSTETVQVTPSGLRRNGR